MSDEDQAEEWMRVRNYWYDDSMYLPAAFIRNMLAAYGNYIKHWYGRPQCTGLNPDDDKLLKEMGISGDDLR